MNNTATNSTPCPTVRKQIGKTTYIAVSYTHLDVYKRQGLLYWLEHCSPLLKWQSFSQMLCGLKKQISQSP